MAKETKQFVKVTITGYVPAPHILDIDGHKKMVGRLGQIESFAHENMQDATIAHRAVNRLVETKPAQKPTDAETSGVEE